MRYIRLRRFHKNACFISVMAIAVFALSANAAIAETSITIPISSSSIQATVDNATYTGSPLHPLLVLRINGADLKHGVDYVTSWRNNVNAGTASVRVAGRGRYAGTRTLCFTIEKCSMSQVQVHGINNTYFYTDSPIKPRPEVMLGSKLLQEGRDYRLEYANCNAPGNATMTLVGLRNMRGLKSLRFAITDTKSSRRDIKKASAKVADKTYSGKRIRPRVTLKLGNVKLKERVDYKLVFSNNLHAGKATIKAVGIGKYRGSKTFHFRIMKKPIGSCKIGKLRDQIWNGEKLKPKIIVKHGLRKLKMGRDYTVSYRDNKDTGTACAIIRGKGNYNGIEKKAFSIKSCGNELAQYACRVSYSRISWHGGGYDGTTAWNKVFKSIRGGMSWSRACCTAVYGIARWAGYDDNWPFALGPQYEEHLKRSRRWKVVGDWDRKESSLQPGDILVCRNSSNGKIGYSNAKDHVLIYVGKDIPKEIYRRYLKGTDADRGYPTKGSVFVSAHGGGSMSNTKNGIGGSAAPCITDAQGSYLSLNCYKHRKIAVVRAVKPPAHKTSKYRNVQNSLRPQ